VMARHIQAGIARPFPIRPIAMHSRYPWRFGREAAERARPCDPRKTLSDLFGIRQVGAFQSALMLAARITFPPFSVSAATNVPKSGEEPGGPLHLNRQHAL
jgi:hypothetical protein